MILIGSRYTCTRFYGVVLFLFSFPVFFFFACTVLGFCCGPLMFISLFVCLFMLKSKTLIYFPIYTCHPSLNPSNFTGYYKNCPLISTCAYTKKKKYDEN